MPFHVSLSERFTSRHVFEACPGPFLSQNNLFRPDSSSIYLNELYLIYFPISRFFFPQKNFFGPLGTPENRENPVVSEFNKIRLGN